MKVILSGGLQFDPPFIFQEELTQCQCNFKQLLKNLFKVSWRQKNAGIICYMLTSLACLQQENVKKSRKLMKLANIDEENLHIFLATWGTLMKFSEKMCLIIILKVTKKQGFTSSVENTVLKKPQGGDQIDSPSLFRVKKTLHHRSLTGFWIFLRFWIYQDSKCARVTQGI